MVLTWRKRCVDGFFKYLAIEGDEFSVLSVGGEGGFIDNGVDKFVYSIMFVCS